MTHDQADQLLRAACNFQGLSKQARERCRDAYREAETSQENTLRILIDGQIAQLPDKLRAKVDATDEKTSYQISVSASFVRTHFVITDLILDGDLVEAIVLIRKQLESLARLHELNTKPLQKLAGKVPNIQNVLKGDAARLYGDLSEVAHMSKPRVGELLEIFRHGELIGPSLMPTYSRNSAACFDMNSFIAIYFLAWIVERLPALYSKYNNSEDKRLLAMTLKLALECGVIRIPEEQGKRATDE
jgi:hypothetical protein